MNFIFSSYLISFTIASFLLIVLSGLVLFFERKFIGIAQKRLGISFLGRNGWLHLPADLIKFWFKDSNKTQSFWFYNTGGIFVILSIYYVWNLLSLTFFVNNSNSLNYDFLNFQILLYFAYANLTTLYLFFIVYSLKSKYALIGGIRLLLVNIFLEFSFVLNFYVIYIYTGGFSFSDSSYMSSWSSFVLSLPITSIIFLIYSLYESKRAPFDHAEAESELVAGHITEFSGKSLLFFFLSEYIHLYLCIFLILLFLFGNIETLIFIQFLIHGDITYDFNTQFLDPITDFTSFDSFADSYIG